MKDNHLQNLEDLDQIRTLSFSPERDGVFVFKHSPRCIISNTVYKRLLAGWSGKEPFYVVNVVDHRDISNEIAHYYSVQHESPQLLHIKNGKCIAHASHHNVLEMAAQ